jgi:antitoxin component YwqK of YwqJK toxin-antitoxin module
MKRLFLIVLPLLLIVGCSELEGQQLIPDITERYSNGGIKSIYYHKKTRNGIEKVKYEEYYYNGQKKIEKTFKDDETYGLVTNWYENGQKKKEYTYKDGEFVGLYTRWNENGQKWIEENYKDGKLISKKEWNEDGSVKE